MFHSIFEVALAKLKDIGKENVAKMPADKIDALVQDLTDDYIGKICSGTKMTQRLNHLFERMRVNLLVIVNHLVNEFLHSSFEAKYFELSFNGDGNSTPLPIKNLTLYDGTPIILHGIADRVDVYRNNNTTYVRIIDYKTGKKEFEMSKFNDGTQLQLFIYLFALWKLEDCNFRKALLDNTDKILPAGAYYLPLSVGKVTKKKDLPSNSDDEEKIDFISEVMPSGLILNDSEIRLAQDSSADNKFSPVGDKSYISEDEFEQMFNNMKDIVLSIGTTMMSGDASVCEDGGAFSACEYCEMKPFCRRGTK
jgi:ATP-dependent helicase/nuclease subunit B